MLDTSACDDYLLEVQEFADKTNQRADLDEQLAYLRGYACSEEDPEAARCRLFKDFAPMSFEFLIERRTKDGKYVRMFNGGLIYHGSHDRGGDGGLPTLSVNTSDKRQGWTVNT